MEELHKLPNIGKELEQLLIKAGISSPEILFSTGSREAFKMIMKVDADACINKLYALEGACQKIRWHGLDRETKKELKEFYDLMTNQ